MKKINKYKGINNFAGWIQKERQVAGIVKADVAERMWLSSTMMISKIDNAQCYPSLPILKTMCKMYRLDLYETLKFMFDCKFKDACDKLGLWSKNQFVNSADQPEI